MRLVFAGPLALVVAVVALAGCSSTPKAHDVTAKPPYNASATIDCFRDRIAAASRPSRAAAREVLRGSGPSVVSYIGRSGSTIGLSSPGGDFQVAFTSEDAVDFHFARSAHEASSLLRDYRSNLRPQVGEFKAEQLTYRRRNVVEEWEDSVPTFAEQRTVDACLMRGRAGPAPLATHTWHLAPVPESYSGTFAPERLPRLKLVPRDAEAGHAWLIRRGGVVPPQVAVEWQRESLLGSDLDTGGIVIWQRVGRSPSWHRVYSLLFPPYRVFGLSVRTGDVNGDGRDDLLLFEDMGGSGGCGIYRLLATVGGRMKQLAVRHACDDSAILVLRHGALVMYDGIVKDPRTLNDIHCCWSVWLRTEMRWRGATPVRNATSRTASPSVSLRNEAPLMVQ